MCRHAVPILPCVAHVLQVDESQVSAVGQGQAMLLCTAE